MITWVREKNMIKWIKKIFVKENGLKELIE